MTLKAADSSSRNSGDESKLLEVAAGLVFRNRKVLITQRRSGSHLGGLWEFPGGKRHAGESYASCVRRELMEEVGIEVEVGELIEAFTHSYPERDVHLRFFSCRWLRFEPRALDCLDYRWVQPEDLSAYPFPEADTRLLCRLKTERELWEKG